MLWGGIVLSDRSVTTSLAYQAFGRELGISKVWGANKFAVNGVFPDVVIYMNVGREICFKRSGGEDPDKFDKNDPHGQYSIEETRLIIREELYPILSDHLHEGRILRDRQV